MIKEDFEEFVSKKVRIVVRSTWCYNGTLVSLSDTTLTLDDKKAGIVKFDIRDIASIQELEW